MHFLDYVIKQCPFRMHTVRTDRGHACQAQFHWHLDDYGIRHVYIKAPARDRTITLVKTLGRRRWKQASGYHRQGRVENTFFRYKSIIGAGLRARSVEQLGLRLSRHRVDASGTRPLGLAAGDTRHQMLGLRTHGDVTLVVADTAVALADLIDFARGAYMLDTAAIRHLIDAATTADPQLHAEHDAARGPHARHAGTVRALANGLPRAEAAAPAHVRRVVRPAACQARDCGRLPREHHPQTHDRMAGGRHAGRLRRRATGRRRGRAAGARSGRSTTLRPVLRQPGVDDSGNPPHLEQSSDSCTVRQNRAPATASRAEHGVLLTPTP